MIYNDESVMRDRKLSNGCRDTYLADIGNRHRSQSTHGKAIEKLAAKEHLISSRDKLQRDSCKTDQQRNENSKLAPNGISNLTRAESANDSGSDRSTAESRLPFRLKHPAPLIVMAEVLAELRDTGDIAGRLVLETDEQNTPDGVGAPEEGPGILLQTLPFIQYMVFLVGDMAELLVLRVLNEVGTGLFHCAVDRGDIDISKM